MTKTSTIAHVQAREPAGATLAGEEADPLSTTGEGDKGSHGPAVSQDGAIGALPSVAQLEAQKETLARRIGEADQAGTVLDARHGGLLLDGGDTDAWHAENEANTREKQSLQAAFKECEKRLAEARRREERADADRFEAEATAEADGLKLDVREFHSMLGRMVSIAESISKRKEAIRRRGDQLKSLAPDRRPIAGMLIEKAIREAYEGIQSIAPRHFASPLQDEGRMAIQSIFEATWRSTRGVTLFSPRRAFAGPGAPTMESPTGGLSKFSGNDTASGKAQRAATHALTAQAARAHSNGPLKSYK